MLEVHNGVRRGSPRPTMLYCGRCMLWSHASTRTTKVTSLLSAVVRVLLAGLIVLVRSEDVGNRSLYHGFLLSLAECLVPCATRFTQRNKAPLRVRRTTKYEGPTGAKDLHVKQERCHHAAQKNGNHVVLLSLTTDLHLQKAKAPPHNRQCLGIGYKTSQLRTLSVRSNPGLFFLPCFLRSM